MRALGISIGSSSIGLVLADQQHKDIKFIHKINKSHDGNPRNALLSLMKEIDLTRIDHLAVTGKKLRHSLQAESISEPEAIEKAYEHLKHDLGLIQHIVSAGGESFIVYHMGPRGEMIHVNTGNKCASGTGEFFVQQLKRMDMGLEDQPQSHELDQPYKVAGRCSVFCKSDCTHALNKGVPRSEVVAGLSEMMSGKIVELLPRGEKERVLLIGGTSHNEAMVHYLREHVKELIIPESADVFEAMGASLYALEHKSPGLQSLDTLFQHNLSSFNYLDSLEKFKEKVDFKDNHRSKALKTDRLLLGLDVGSTTTKAVLIKESDSSIVADIYLRTNGDPIQASRNCYSELRSQITAQCEIIGLGVTGSGRQIAGLFALTPSVINEIIAHATAAVYYDPEVDTIFEIGGQDAKYTYITNGVASDYAMNEACSAGTGSFLEEAALESLNLKTEAIGDIALKSDQPPNFSDQCSAFINSDIKSAIQEGITIENIAAGLVYSVCMNYNNRVRGSRPVGDKIFMQGGVCYNKAVPVAMAALTGKKIIVPPDPGLMGAFGVALVVKQRLELGLAEEQHISLDELIDRTVSYKEPFICAGGKEKCDRKCSINRIEIKDRIYPFGGACNKYYGIKGQTSPLDMEKLDLVQLRETMVYQTYSRDYSTQAPLKHTGKTVAVNKALMTNTLFPFYYNFFSALGYTVLLNDKIDPEGIDRKGSAFCYPVEITHGSISELIKIDADIYFLPHLRSLPISGGWESSVTCPFIQAEPYYLTSSFPELKEKQVLSPVLDFAKGMDTQLEVFQEMAGDLGHNDKDIESAYRLALKAQQDFHTACLDIGQQVLQELSLHPEEIALVLFGRPYNAFSKMANMGIPHKFASREYRIIPHDFILPQSSPSVERMYWAMGQSILKTAQFVADQPQLYGVYISNFSCGPDSFVISYFRNIMKTKPSLTLELDSHTADAGVDTRIEAYLDVVKSYRELKRSASRPDKGFRAATTLTQNKEFWIIDSEGKQFRLDDPRVKLLFPSMGDLGTRSLAAAFRYAGVNAVAARPAAEEELKLGRGNASCKECLPLQITMGTLLKYLQERKDENELLVYFMPETSGPCRFGQYNILLSQLIEDKKLKNVALLSLSSENSYAGLTTEVVLKTWQSVIISDVLDEIFSAILVMAQDKEQALNDFETSVQNIEHALESLPWKGLKQVLEQEALRLSLIPLNSRIEECPQVALVGEIFVRRDGLSRGGLIEKLAQKGVIVKAAPVHEWMYYTDYIVKKQLVDTTTLLTRLATTIKGYFKSHYEKSIKASLAKSGLYQYHEIDIDRLVDNVKDLISPRLTGEAILTVGTAITEVAEEVSGVISIGPFGCMPGRIAESLIKENINIKKLEVSREQELVKAVLEHYPQLPYMAIEVDGNVFTQGTEARLETFVLQAKRVHNRMMDVRKAY